MEMEREREINIVEEVETKMKATMWGLSFRLRAQV